MVVDHMDNLYIVDITQTSNLPNRTNSHPRASYGRCAFVTKLSPAGIILWSTYLSGSDQSYGYGITIDPKGNNVFIVGDTDTGEDFPKLLNPDWQSAGGAYVASLEANNGTIQWTRLLTRNDVWHYQGICLHKNHLFVTGLVGHRGELINPKNKSSGGNDAFLYQLAVDGKVINCCFFGGWWGGEAGNDLFIDDEDNIYLIGEVFWEYPGENNHDYDLPKEINEWRGHRRDGFICKFSSALDVQWSRYIGGKEVDYAHQVIGDNQGNLWIAGKAHSDDMEGELIVPWNGHNE